MSNVLGDETSDCSTDESYFRVAHDLDATQ